MKTCTKCKKTLKLSEFYSDINSKDRLTYACKACDKVTSRNTYLRRKQKRRKIRNFEVNLTVPSFLRTEKYKDYTLKSTARRTLQRAVDKGILKRSAECSDCKKEIFTEGHHLEYNKPLEVVWLCKKCHAKAHKLLQ